MDSERPTRILPFAEKRDDVLGMVRACVTPVVMFSRFARFEDDEGRLYMPRFSLTEHLLGRPIDYRIPEEEFYVDYYIPPLYKNAELRKQQKTPEYIPKLVKPQHLVPGHRLTLEIRERAHRRGRGKKHGFKFEASVVSVFDGEAMTYRDGEIVRDTMAAARGLARVRVLDFPSRSLLIENDEYYHDRTKILFV